MSQKQKLQKSEKATLFLMNKEEKKYPWINKEYINIKNIINE